MESVGVITTRLTRSRVQSLTTTTALRAEAVIPALSYSGTYLPLTR